MEKIIFRRLDSSNEDDREVWREVFRGTPSFIYASQDGSPPTDADADRLMDMRPYKEVAESICYLAIYFGSELCGCLRITPHHPAPTFAFFPWFVIMEKFQRGYVSIRAFRAVEELARSWGCHRLVGIVFVENERAFRFWLRLGMQEFYRVLIPGVAGEAIVCCGKPLGENVAIEQTISARLRQSLDCLKPIIFRRLDTSKTSDRGLWQQVFRGTPSFTYGSQGRAPTDADADRLMDAFPPSKTAEEIYIFAIYAGSELCGCAQMTPHYPADGQMFLAWLILMEGYQGQQLGAVCFQRIEALAKFWNCNQVNLLVDSANGRGLRFWESLGFVERERFAQPWCVGEAILCDLVLESDLVLGQPLPQAT
jgi:RimJ/RimL family protein N-acetyltransferase